MITLHLYTGETLTFADGTPEDVMRRTADAAVKRAEMQSATQTASRQRVEGLEDPLASAVHLPVSTEPEPVTLRSVASGRVPYPRSRDLEIRTQPAPPDTDIADSMKSRADWVEMSTGTDKQLRETLDSIEGSVGQLTDAWRMNVIHDLRGGKSPGEILHNLQYYRRNSLDEPARAFDYTTRNLPPDGDPGSGRPRVAPMSPLPFVSTPSASAISYAEPDFGDVTSGSSTHSLTSHEAHRAELAELRRRAIERGDMSAEIDHGYGTSGLSDRVLDAGATLLTAGTPGLFPDMLGHTIFRAMDDTLGVSATTAASANLGAANLPRLPMVAAETAIRRATGLADPPGQHLSIPLSEIPASRSAVPDPLGPASEMSAGWQDEATRRLAESSSDLPTPAAASLFWGATTAGLMADASQYVGVGEHPFGVGGHPLSELEQIRLARSGQASGATEPLLYIDRSLSGGSSAAGRIKGRLPDKAREVLDLPWRRYGDIPLERPTGPEPRPRSVNRDPQPIEIIGGDEAERARVQGLWDYASRRYPRITSGIDEIHVKPGRGAYLPGNRIIEMDPADDLGMLVHELTHTAQDARSGGKLGTVYREELHEPAAVRVGDAYSRVPEPAPRYSHPARGTVDGGAGLPPGVETRDVGVRAEQLPTVPRTDRYEILRTSDGKVAVALPEVVHDTYGTPIRRPLTVFSGPEAEDSARAMVARYWSRENGTEVPAGAIPETGHWPGPPTRVGVGAAPAPTTRPEFAPLTSREYSTAMAGTDPGLVPLSPGFGTNADARAFSAWIHKNNINPEHAERFGEIPDLQEQFFELHNPDPDLEPFPEPRTAGDQRAIEEWQAHNGSDDRPWIGAYDAPEYPPGDPVETPPHAYRPRPDQPHWEPLSPHPVTSDRAAAVLGPERATEYTQLQQDLLALPRRTNRLEDATIAAARDRIMTRIENLTEPLSDQEVNFLFGSNDWAPPNYLGDAEPAVNRGGRVLGEISLGADGTTIESAGPVAANSNVRGPSRVYARGGPPKDYTDYAAGQLTADGWRLGPHELPESVVAEQMGWKLPDGPPRQTQPVDPIRIEHGQTNIAAQIGGPDAGYFGDPEVAGYVIANSEEVFHRLGPPQTWDTLEEMASRLGTTREEFLSHPSQWATLPPEQRLRLTYVIKGNEEKISALQAKLAAGEASDLEKGELLRAIDTRSDLIVLGAKTGSDYGRALNSLKIEARLALSDDQLLRQKLYRQYSKQLDTEKPLMDALARLDPKNPNELQAFLRHVNKPKWYEYAQEYWVSSILSALATHERNFIGNTLNAVMENAVVRPVAAGFDAARTIGPGAASDAIREVFFRETPAALLGLTRGIRQGLRKGFEVLRRGYDPAAMQGKLFPVRSAFARSQNRVVREVIGPVVTAPLRALAASDALFKVMNHTAEIYAQAARTAAKEGLHGDAFAARAATLVGNPTDEMMAAADAFALKATFNDEASAVGKGIINLRDLPNAAYPNNPGLQKALESYRLASGFILPFVKIADRLMVRGFEYTPLGAIPAIGARRAGSHAAAADYAARAAIGSSILAYAGSLAMEGRLTAGAPTDEGEKAAYFGANKQAWSARTDDGVWIPYGNLQPIGTAFALAAAAWKGWSEHGEAPNVEKLGHAAAQIGVYVTDQSYLDALSKFMDAIGGSEADRGRAFSDLATNTAWGFHPYSGLTRSIARGIDPRVIDAKTIADKLKQNVPGVSLGMDARLTPWGEDVVPAGGRLRSVLAPGSILLPSQEHLNPLDQELERLGTPLGYVGKTIADRFGDGPSRGSWKLAPHEWYLYQQLAGRASKQVLTQLQAQEGYAERDADMQRDQTQKAIEMARKYARIMMVRYHRDKKDAPIVQPSWQDILSTVDPVKPAF